MKSFLLTPALLTLFVACNQTTPPPTVTAKYSCAPVTTDRAWYDGDNKAPLFESMGDLHFPISTKNELVQKYFNQGMTLAYGFNHAEAARSFYYATKLDSTCAMAYWGYAYVLGPNYNAGMESDSYERAYSAIQKAVKLSEQNTTEKEKALIQAMAKRYVKEPVDDRHELDESYSEAMGDLFKQYPNDPDIGTLYAESMMDLHPWDLFDKSGTAKEWTPEIISTIETVIEKHPNHSGAHHLYIHAVEASQTPQRGLESAKKLFDGLVPNAGHLVHMPSHIYIRTGDYHQGTLANIAAIKVDSSYVTACNAQGVYPLAYFPHNQHFMAATATLEGNSHWAMYAAQEVAKTTNKQLMKEPGWGTLQHYYTIPYYIAVKFGKWDDILEIKNETPDLEYPTAIWHYARGMAFLGKNQLTEAQDELNQLRQIAANEELRNLTIWDINSVYDLLQIAERVLKAEILVYEKLYPESVELLKQAIVIEDNLNYNEPPDWFFSVRHHLGPVQMKAGNYEAAIETYKEDLQRLPKNGWALKGLTVAYSKLENTEEAALAKSQFKEAWAHADVEISTSVIQ